jgi:hypothetical protein
MLRCISKSQRHSDSEGTAQTQRYYFINTKFLEGTAGASDTESD